MPRNSKSILEAADSDSVVKKALNISEYPTVPKIRQSQSVVRFALSAKADNSTLAVCKIRVNQLSLGFEAQFPTLTCQSDTMNDAEKTPKNGGGQSGFESDSTNNARVFRILDASINRASEGLRVVESYCRMVLGDVFLAGELKSLRHDLSESCAEINAESRLRSRESELDVGRTIQTDTEYERADFESLIRSNMSRVQQATRTIEEFSKLSFATLAPAIEQIRYRAYTIEKAVFNTAFNRSRFENDHLYVLIDACEERSGFQKMQKLVAELVAAEVDLIQLRDKALSDRELVKAGKLLGELTRATTTRWIMNDRVDLAVAARADGVHLGQDDLSVHEARAVLSSNQFVGVSTHSIEQVRQAVVDGADYIGVGPVFESQTKSFESFVGVELVKRVCEGVTLPAFAIGGINSENISKLVEVGCRRIAVSSAVCAASDRSLAAEKIRSSLLN